MTYLFPNPLTLWFTCVIVAEGVKGILGIHISVHDDTSGVLRTVLMLPLSQDGGGHIVGPAVPEWWHISVTYKLNTFGFI